MEREPLLPSATDSSIRDKRTCNSSLQRRSIIAMFFVVLSGFLICLAALPSTMKPPTRPRNVILLISDGFGPASQTLARNYYTELNNLPASTTLPLDSILVGSSRTRSSDSLITDSAAGATAFSCGLKTYNGAVGLDKGTLIQFVTELPRWEKVCYYS